MLNEFSEARTQSPWVAVLDEEGVGREALLSLLERRGFRCFPCDSVAQFIGSPRAAETGAVLLGIRSRAKERWAGLIPSLRSQLPGIPFVLLSWDEGGELRSLLDGLSDGHVVASDGSAALSAALEAALERRTLALLTPPPKEPFTRLTGREREVLDCVAAGLDNLAIAEALQIAERTVKAHISALYRKLGVDSRVKLTLAALRVQPLSS